MKGEYVQMEVPLEVLENLFSALQLLRPNMLTRLEKQAINMLKDQIYYGLESYMETEEEAEARRMKFRQLFEEERQKRIMHEEREKAAY